MPRLRRLRVDDRRRLTRHQNRQQQVVDQAVDNNHDHPVIAAMNDLAVLQLQHPAVNVPIPQGTPSRIISFSCQHRIT